ncbi:DUF3889 domain-containing protein [Bacillus sp. NEB1478]|uniref:DUF3889 domain-containing protein n=1 Tax=Bacillus sp. NEB1478 TaxID=3073816 RepID=UPI002872E14B|nr:DUF3889 domain-containing protein [Bacillus sp. NEB1478]WNB92308.1 DUF3889 domain-containing protein [Bacillus sp. NEB1478]
MKQKATIFMIIFALFLSVGCMKKEDKKTSMPKRENMGTYDAQNRNTPLNVDTNLSRKDYAKWGKLALEETKKEYPNSRISDYQYDVRRIAPDGTITDWFDFTVYQKNRKHLVKVGVMHSEDKLIDYKFEERT